MALDLNVDPTGLIGLRALPKANVFVDESNKRLYSVEHGLNFQSDSWSPGSIFNRLDL